MPVGEVGRGGGDDGINLFIQETIMKHSRGDGEVNLDGLDDKKFWIKRTIRARTWCTRRDPPIPHFGIETYNLTLEERNGPGIKREGVKGAVRNWTSASGCLCRFSNTPSALGRDHSVAGPRASAPGPRCGREGVQGFSHWQVPPHSGPPSNF